MRLKEEHHLPNLFLLLPGPFDHLDALIANTADLGEFFYIGFDDLKGFLAEFLDDLPYRSSIMRLTEEDWYRLSVGEQQAIVNNIKSKIRRYTQIHDDVANWVTFGAAEPGDAVYRVPLSLMP